MIHLLTRASEYCSSTVLPLVVVFCVRFALRLLQTTVILLPVAIFWVDMYMSAVFIWACIWAGVDIRHNNGFEYES